ncbi:MAG: hypothetical protein M3083_00365 [Actinomycetota bacterium]|nr:hypothetical protein [Actinomycetota bacterium]MDQ6948211.1 hypothetical protein [Actinomycetota bacterium]
MVMVVVLAVAGCGGGGNSPVSTGTSTSTDSSVTSTDSGVTSTPPASNSASTNGSVTSILPSRGSTVPVTTIYARPTTTVKGKNMSPATFPGPPGSFGPPNLSDPVNDWYRLAAEEVPRGECQKLLDDVALRGADAGNATGGGPGYVSLYRGIAEGCLGMFDRARSDLAEARRLRVGLLDDGSADPTCNPQLLLVFGFNKYLNTVISPTCPTSTTQPQTTTT